MNGHAVGHEPSNQESPLRLTRLLRLTVLGRGTAYNGFDASGSELFRVGLHLIGGDSLSMDDTGQLYFHDGGILCAIA